MGDPRDHRRCTFSDRRGKDVPVTADLLPGEDRVSLPEIEIAQDGRSATSTTRHYERIPGTDRFRER